MKQTLRYGSAGKAVAELQKGLNLLPTQHAQLKVDGIYGPKTTARVREFQGANGLVSDGVTGPLTWEKFLKILAEIQKGGTPALPGGPSAMDLFRPLALTIAQQYLGVVQFPVNGMAPPPKGLDFLIEMFQFAAGTQLTEANFRHPTTKLWHWVPWVGGQQKNWCGIFCVYCYRKAGLLGLTWYLGGNLGLGGPYLNGKRLQQAGLSPSFVSDIRPGDIGCVQTAWHHFFIESVDGSGPYAPLTTLDGNGQLGAINRRHDHQVRKDNFNYYIWA